MGRLYCMHMTPIDEHCDECPPTVDIWDAARAWQAFRDFLNGTPEQWQQYAEGMYAYGRQLGWEDV